MGLAVAVPAKGMAAAAANADGPAVLDSRSESGALKAPGGGLTLQRQRPPAARARAPLDVRNNIHYLWRSARPPLAVLVGALLKDSSSKARQRWLVAWPHLLSQEPGVPLILGWGEEALHRWEREGQVAALGRAARAVHVAVTEAGGEKPGPAVIAAHVPTRQLNRALFRHQLIKAHDALICCSRLLAARGQVR